MLQSKAVSGSVRCWSRLSESRKFRDAEGLFAIEGTRSLLTAVECGYEIQSIIRSHVLLQHSHAAKVLRDLRRGGTRVTDVSPELFRQMSRLPRASGVAAVAVQKWGSVSDIDVSDGFSIAVSRIRSVGNLGTLMRSSVAAGCSGVVLIGDGVDPFGPACVRASMGSIFRTKLIRLSWREFDIWKSKADAFVVGADPEADVSYFEASYRFPSVIMLGDERSGLSSRQRQHCDQLVSIPMHASCDSLNLGVAGSLLMYELRRRLNPVGT